VTDPGATAGFPTRRWARLCWAVFVTAVAVSIGAGLATIGLPPPTPPRYLPAEAASSTADLRDEPGALLAAVTTPGTTLGTTVSLLRRLIVVRPAARSAGRYAMADAVGQAGTELGTADAMVLCRLGLLSTTYVHDTGSAGYFNLPVWVCVQVLPGVNLPGSLGRPTKVGAVDFIDANAGTRLFSLPAVG